MPDDKPQLTLVTYDYSADHDAEFVSLPEYHWDERPVTLPLDTEECATAIHLSHGSLPSAAKLLKVSEIRLKRLVKQSPRLQRVLEESFELALDRAVAIPIDTLFDPNADARRLEWASTKLLQSRLAQGHPLSPAPSSTTASNVTINNREIVFSWREAPSLTDGAGRGDGSGE
jgi:hypothetical protein